MSNASLSFIHRFEPGLGPGRPPILLLHGTGGDESDLLPIGQAIAPGSALLSPRGKVLENGMPRFFRRLAEGIFDEEDLIRRTHELAQFINEAAAHYQFERQRLLAVGYSNGANIAGGLLLLRPDAICGAALLRPMVPLIPETLPDLHGAPVLVAAANQDPIVPAENAQQLVALLRSAGADVTVSFENAGHGLTENTIDTAKRWFMERTK